MKFSFLFAWYDFWVGWFWDKVKRRLYVFPVPMIGVRVDFPTTPLYRCMFRYSMAPFGYASQCALGQNHTGPCVFED